MDRLISACYFAAVKHRSQKRKDKYGTPYINHPIHVANLLVNAGVTDVDIIIAGLLHDTVEDTGTTADEITREFGARVSDMVMECTDDKTLPKVIRKQLQIEHAALISTGAKLIKLADKYSNLSDLICNPPTFWSAAEVRGYSYWSYAVYEQLRGTNIVFDKLFDDLFTGLDINGCPADKLSSELESYYHHIKNSD